MSLKSQKQTNSQSSLEIVGKDNQSLRLRLSLLDHVLTAPVTPTREANTGGSPVPIVALE